MTDGSEKDGNCRIWNQPLALAHGFRNRTLQRSPG